MGKCGPRRNRKKYKLLERFRCQLLKMQFFIEFEPLYQKVWAFMSNLPKTTRKNMVMSRDPGFKFRKFLFFAKFCIKF